MGWSCEEDYTKDLKTLPCKWCGKNHFTGNCVYIYAFDPAAVEKWGELKAESVRLQGEALHNGAKKPAQVMFSDICKRVNVVGDELEHMQMLCGVVDMDQEISPLEVALVAESMQEKLAELRTAKFHEE